MKKRVIVAMSGGVDSSVAALLLKEQGYDVVGVTMRLWSSEDDSKPKNNKRCCSVEDVEDARKVCDILGINHYHLNFEKEFQKYVVDYFVNSYIEGKTPHPCLACNDKIKFDFLYKRAQNLGSDLIATGHYARIKKEYNEYKLYKGLDHNKDQSYVLFTLKQKELKNLLLPVGEYKKEKINNSIGYLYKINFRFKKLVSNILIGNILEKKTRIFKIFCEKGVIIYDDTKKFTIIEKKVNTYNKLNFLIMINNIRS